MLCLSKAWVGKPTPAPEANEAKQVLCRSGWVSVSLGSNKGLCTRSEWDVAVDDCGVLVIGWLLVTTVDVAPGWNDDVDLNYKLFM